MSSRASGLADERGRDAHGDGPGIAQSFHHAILPLASMHDRRTEVRWGLRDFEHRFGRRAVGLWLPEAAADLADAPDPRRGGRAGHDPGTLAGRTRHISRAGPTAWTPGAGHIDVLFYDAGLSSSVSFEPDVTADADRFARERIAPRLGGRLDGGGVPVVAIASDGELYGHHQSFRDLFLDRLVAPEPATPDRGFDVVSLARATREHEGSPHPEIRIRERTSWSCHHGVLRWSGECPCAHDGRWKAPLRAAFERLAGAIDTVTEALADDITGATDIWGARDRYVDVIIGAEGADAFAQRELGPAGRGRRPAPAARRDGGPAVAPRDVLLLRLVLGRPLADRRRARCMRCAARAVRIVDGHAGTTLEERLLADLGTLISPSLGVDGATIYRHALSEVGQPPPHAS